MLLYLGTPTNTSIWSPAVTDPCIESQRSGGSLGSGGSSYAGGGVATTTANCYPAPHQNYNPYYSNMEYLGPSPISHSQLNLVSFQFIFVNRDIFIYPSLVIQFSSQRLTYSEFRCSNPKVLVGSTLFFM